jgi:hypothetical protein
MPPMRNPSMKSLYGLAYQWIEWIEHKQQHSMNESEADKLAPVILDFFEFVMKHKPQTARKKTPPKVQAAQAVKMPPSKLKLLTHEIAQDSYQIHCASRFSRSGILRRTSL